VRIVKERRENDRCAVARAVKAAIEGRLQFCWRRKADFENARNFKAMEQIYIMGSLAAVK
jgi:hypothetical protein